MLKKVLLLGDSIRMGYQDLVRALLEGKCEVFFEPEDNGRFASYTLWQANQMFKKYGHFSIVHFNTGYWDMNIEEPMIEPMTPIKEYGQTLTRIAKLCKENSDCVVFGTTLPLIKPIRNVDDVTGTTATMSYDNNSVLAYNTEAIRIMRKEHVDINNLYTLMLKDKNYYKCEDNLHLTSEGYMACAKQIARVIEEKLLYL